MVNVTKWISIVNITYQIENMKNLLYAIICFLIISCGTSISGINYGASMKTTFENTISKVQFDSLCKADTITNDLNKWKKTVFMDGETDQYFQEYCFIKKNGTVYRCQQQKDSFVVSKRVIK